MGPFPADDPARGQGSVDTGAWLAERFEEHRGRLRAVAYRMLGSLDEADDAVQEAWVRVSAAGADEVVNLGGWLTVLIRMRGRPAAVMAFTVVGGRITAIDGITDPRRVRRLVP